MELFNLKGKVAMITGGNTGIGKSLAIGLAKAGADIYIFCHSYKEIDELKIKIESIGRQFDFGIGDLSKEAIATTAVLKCIDRFKKIDILVNNAGTIIRNPILEGKNEDWKKIIDLNLSSIYYLSKTASIYMKKQKSGKIINIASLLSFQGGKYVPSYTASKHGVIGLTKAFSNELAKDNIQINAIAPGYIETANTQSIRKNLKRNKEILDRIPANKWGQTVDIIGGAIFLASKASDYVNGHTLVIDGGWLSR